jgi:hypothetical protein
MYTKKERKKGTKEQRKEAKKEELKIEEGRNSSY